VPEKLGLAEGAFNGCFGCGPDNPVGLKLAFERNGEVVRSRTTITRAYAGYRDFAHGGIVATMLDEAMGWAMLHVAGTHGVTKALRVTYRRPVRVERPIVVVAKLASRRGVDLVLEAHIEDDRGRVLARAEGEWVSVREERSGA
jgi:acyl-coenzyme A thioesterase PaaI-like protein